MRPNAGISAMATNSNKRARRLGFSRNRIVYRSANRDCPHLQWPPLGSLGKQKQQRRGRRISHSFWSKRDAVQVLYYRIRLFESPQEF
jgi:hypothetical protein